MNLMHNQSHYKTDKNISYLIITLCNKNTIFTFFYIYFIILLFFYLPGINKEKNNFTLCNFYKAVALPVQSTGGQQKNSDAV